MSFFHISWLLNLNKKTRWIIIRYFKKRWVKVYEAGHTVEESAFGADYTDALLELIKENASQFADPNNVIDFVYNMAPHQAGDIATPEVSMSILIIMIETSFLETI